jgi:class 3 adenylate cyclase
VLFCDVENFTSYCYKHEPEDVVSRLDALFVIFEQVAAKARSGKDKNGWRRVHGGGWTAERV